MPTFTIHTYKTFHSTPIRMPELVKFEKKVLRFVNTNNRASDTNGGYKRVNWNVHNSKAPQDIKTGIELESNKNERIPRI